MVAAAAAVAVAAAAAAVGSSLHRALVALTIGHLAWPICDDQGPISSS